LVYKVYQVLVQAMELVVQQVQLELPAQAVELQVLKVQVVQLEHLV
jgi:hypothetical protein